MTHFPTGPRICNVIKHNHRHLHVNELVDGGSRTGPGPENREYAFRLLKNRPVK
jgi:hypothetical protein